MTGQIYNPMIGLVFYICLIASATNALASNKASIKTHTAPIEHNVKEKWITIADENSKLILRLNYDRKCLIDKVIINNKEIISSGAVYSGFKINNNWFTSHSNLTTPSVIIMDNRVIVTNIHYGGEGIDVNEKWTFTTNTNSIIWNINRKYSSSGILEDICFPCWDFDMRTWTGAFLGNGGMVWCKFFDKAHSTYGVHVGEISLWNKENDACLRIIPESQTNNHFASKFTRQAQDIFSLNQYVTEFELKTKYDQYRFLDNKEDIWQPFNISTGNIRVSYTLEALDYDHAYDRGNFVYYNGESIRSILNTIARVGVIDSYIHGSNSWRTPYGPAVLHEQWIAQMGLAIDDSNYFAAYKNTLDFQRDHAIEKDGRVKSRWAYHDGDAMTDTYDSLGFYECQWGYLLDSQPDFVINVSELYHFNADLQWVRTHKESCEKVLEYLIRRDSDGDCLVEMMTDYHSAAKGSDWIDVIWASYENAFINAELYYALTLWAEIEAQLGDTKMATRYKDLARCLRDSFNKKTDDGGFWDADNEWYVYWRDKDNSIHGNNLVIPVNFMAIAYGLCDQINRRKAILDQIEKEMQREKLFFWPLCIYPYKEGEGLGRVNFPFPNYENGDIFLAWGELGVRAYAEYKPQIPLKYIENVLKKYESDGLAFQRYLRKTQTGAGDDILANNCSPVVGLYRNIYGIQPQFNRLYLDPHITDDLSGTKLKYWLRKQIYLIEFDKNGYSIAVNNFKLYARSDFAINTVDNTLHYYNTKQIAPSLTITKSGNDYFEINIRIWQLTKSCQKKWTESSANAQASVTHIVSDLEPNIIYKLYDNGAMFTSLTSDSSGCIKFNYIGGYITAHTFEIK